MAEERLIDTDKDKKYRIRKNEDGEDELYIDENGENENVEEVTFDAPEEAWGESEESLLTPEQAEALRQKEEEERKKRQAEVNALIAQARKDCEESKFATAADCLEKAAEIDPENGEIYALRLIVYTRNFTDYSQIAVAEEYCEEVENYTSKETKEQLFAKASEGLEHNINKLRTRVSDLNEENEKQKAERALKFVSDRNKALVVFCLTFAATLIFAGLAIYFATVIHAVPDNRNLIITIVFAAIAFLVLISTAFAARRLITTSRRVRLNKRNTATKLGRELISEQAKLKSFVAVYEALKG